MSGARTPEQRELAAAVRQVLAAHEGAAAWGPLAGQIGVAGLAIPEEYGGFGAGPGELAVVSEELGRALSPVPFLDSAVLVPAALLASGDTEVCAGLLPELAEGSRTASLAWAEKDAEWDTGRQRTSAALVRGAWRLSGVKEHLPAAGDTLLVVARTEHHGPSLFLVPADAEGVTLTAVPVMDDSRPQWRLELTRAEGVPVGELGSAATALAAALEAGALVLASDAVGGASVAFESTLRYAKDREQFGRPIGSFQAVKHRLADMFTSLESSRSLLAAAVDGEVPAGAAKAACCESFEWIAGEAIQLHGGIAITWEHPAHRWFKRAHSAARLLGSSAWHRRNLALV
ncbi:acyl-CoA dehydrogenase family protein [Streptomyces xanthii]|uniref:Acyl-CoA dehydrogenase family protein n=1 Tax=Streptomyces xanthii TaxID=2768069 RepID=A0A7H1BDJ9_9ACTN|nr:acyl-CoA dehydrogenase family protein [Streptomyces xanthii]QNS06804.1 acyl-CoA dehydrogenase family protein [Streptomyces xanthii]